MNKTQPTKPKSYYLTLFTIKGHKTFRTHLSGHPDQFAKDVKLMKADVVEVRTHIIDRITAEITLQK